jgi:hypothetical protein
MDDLKLKAGIVNEIRSMGRTKKVVYNVWNVEVEV